MIPSSASRLSSLNSSFFSRKASIFVCNASSNSSIFDRTGSSSLGSDFLFSHSSIMLETLSEDCGFSDSASSGVSGSSTNSVSASAGSSNAGCSRRSSSAKSDSDIFSIVTSLSNSKSFSISVFSSSSTSPKKSFDLISPSNSASCWDVSSCSNLFTGSSTVSVADGSSTIGSSSVSGADSDFVSSFNPRLSNKSKPSSGDNIPFLMDSKIFCRSFMIISPRRNVL